jgi:hypothetical protein
VPGAKGGWLLVLSCKVLAPDPGFIDMRHVLEDKQGFSSHSSLMGTLAVRIPACEGENSLALGSSQALSLRT